MTATARKREVGRGEKLLPGVWRLRLPLPWPGVPHCNAWAVAAGQDDVAGHGRDANTGRRRRGRARTGDGIVLFDTGMHEPGSMAHLERALDMVGLKVEHVRLLVCTHAHSDHYGQAATIVDRAGCELWMHPDHRHMTAAAEDPEAAVERRLEVARSAGVPEAPLREWAQRRRGQSFGVARIVEPDRDLLAGMTVASDLGEWEVVETPGHAPSHVCLWLARQRLLISGDHLLGRVSLYYDYGYTPDPAGEFLASLDRVEALDARLCLPGHGRTFSDVHGHIVANRELVAERLAALEDVLRSDGPLTAFEAVPRVYGAALTAMNANWWLSETLCYLRHLQVTSRAAGDGARPERWSAAA
jgi:glyoxylase-like metal-dependent hydrolase (beta-lactamase superfamily II)